MSQHVSSSARLAVLLAVGAVALLPESGFAAAKKVAQKSKTRRKAPAAVVSPVGKDAPPKVEPEQPTQENGDAPRPELTSGEAAPSAAGSGATTEVRGVEGAAPLNERPWPALPPMILEARALVGLPDLGGVSVTVLPWKQLEAEAGGAPALKTFYLRAGAFWPLLDQKTDPADTQVWEIRMGAQLGIRHFGKYGAGLNGVAELAGTYWLQRNLGANFQLTAGTVYVGPNWQFADFQTVSSPWFPDVRASGGVTFQL